MGTILARKRLDGTMGYTVLIRIKKAGKVIHSESKTFDREAAAKAWEKKRETELAEPGAFNKPEDPTLAELIDKYNLDKLKQHGKTKTQVLRTIARSSLGELRCSETRSHHLVDYLKKLDAQPQTRGNYLSHLAAVITVAKPAWGYPIDKSVVEDARVVADKLGIISRSASRTRRPTIDELTMLMRHYELSEGKDRANGLLMSKLIVFSIFSTRRQDESCRVVMEDLYVARSELMVRDMKNPGEKIGNDVVTLLPPEALQLVLDRGIKSGRIWPHNSSSVSASFTRACVILGIEDLHFHDLRHEGISRLFEMGWAIPQVARVSGHRSWKSLQRYSHVKQHGDKFAGWPWTPVVSTATTHK
ncbi:MAG TPA: tyrosine-type recombinase/integrase [Polaromonas sp.]|uniref:tyrosine-type recombinase/integrase n=1 Tax=Polaromonas sp. TaxID=1869339 RepID=UPI002D2D193C|nr:tyrosine-type recombinase/integrase [Polaromonas sp.]HYW57658.1 tyrosine-type recombinase/integrase [Polaromonas sp.]